MLINFQQIIVNEYIFHYNVHKQCVDLKNFLKIKKCLRSLTVTCFALCILCKDPYMDMAVSIIF